MSKSYAVCNARGRVVGHFKSKRVAKFAVKFVGGFNGHVFKVSA